MPNNSKRENHGKQKKKSTAEIVGIVLIVASAFFLFCLILPIALGVIGAGLRSFFTGILGIFSFALFSASIALGIVLLKGKKLAVPKKRAIYIGLISAFGLMILQLITTHSLLGLSYGEHMSAVYNFSDNFSIGGVLFALFPMAVVSAVGTVVAYLFFITLFLTFSALLASDIIKFNRPTGNNKRKYNKTRITRAGDKGYFINSDGGMDLDNVTQNGLFVGEIVPNQGRNKSISGGFSDFSGLEDEDNRIDNRPKATSNFDSLFGIVRDNDDDRRTDALEDRERAREMLLGDKVKRSETDQERYLSSNNIEREVLRGAGASSSPIQSQPMIVGNAKSYGYDDEIYIDEFTGKSASKNRGPAAAEQPALKKTKDKLEVVFQPPIDQESFYDDSVGIIDGAKYSKFIAALSEEQKPPIKQVWQQIQATEQNQLPIEKLDDSFLDLTQRASEMLAQTIQSEPEIRHYDEIIDCSVTSTFSTADSVISAPVATTNPFSSLDLTADQESYYNDIGIENSNGDTADCQKETIMQVSVPEVQAIQEEPFEYTKPAFTPIIQREFIPPAYENDDDNEAVKNEAFADIEKALDSISDGIENISQITTHNIDLSFATSLKSKSRADLADATVFLDEIDEIDDIKIEAKEEEVVDTTFGTTPYKTATEQDNDLKSVFDKDEDFSGAYIKGHNSKPKEFSKRNINPKISQNQIHIDDALKTDKENLPKRPIKKIAKYIKPPLDLLTADSTDPALFGGDSVANAEKLEKKLKSLGLNVEVTGVVPGPAVTRYELTMPSGLPIRKILTFASDIAYELAAKKGVRIEAPISGKRAVGVEVPNQEIGVVSLKDLINSEEFEKASSNVTLCLGKDIAGEIVLSPLEKMPHLLVAGTTGSGKSACLNSLIVSMIYKSSPEDLRLILIDPKRVEFPLYSGLPHLLINQIINEREHAINAFKWVVSEMYERYKVLAAHKAKNIQDYNALKAVKSGELAKLPRIVIVVDELSDLMMGGYKKEMEELILTISQLSRAAGINMILATQRPSVDVITGTIKANLPSRIAFAVSNGTDSKTILDQTGAEMLLGRGDLLYSPIDAPEPVRIQGSYVTTEEVEEIIRFIKENNDAEYFDEVEGVILKEKEVEVPDEHAHEGFNDEYDPLLEEAARMLITTDQRTTSVSFFQRKYGIGFSKAGRIMDQLEEIGFVSAKDHFKQGKPREVLGTIDMFERTFGVSF